MSLKEQIESGKVFTEYGHTAQEDLEYEKIIEAQRRNWCVFRDRRPDLYGALTTLDGGAASSG